MDLVFVPIHLGMHWCLAVSEYVLFLSHFLLPLFFLSLRKSATAQTIHSLETNEDTRHTGWDGGAIIGERVYN